MGTIPGFLLRHTVIIEPYLGHNATGPMYGPPVTTRCFKDDKVRVVRNRQGDEVLSSGTVYCLPGTDAPPLSRVTVNGVPGVVLKVLDRDGGGLPTPDHVELLLE